MEEETSSAENIGNLRKILHHLSPIPPRIPIHRKVRGIPGKQFHVHSRMGHPKWTCRTECNIEPHQNNHYIQTDNRNPNHNKLYPHQRTHQSERKTSSAFLKAINRGIRRQKENITASTVDQESTIPQRNANTKKRIKK